MAYEVNRTASFLADYDAILDYLVKGIGSPQAAGNLMDEVDQAISILGVTPLIHAVSSKDNLCKRMIRVHLLSRYAILYTVSNDSVNFVRLFHQSQFYESDEHWPDSV